MNDDDQNQSGGAQDGDMGGGSQPEPTSEPASDVPIGTPPPSSDEPPSEPAGEIPPPPPANVGGEPGAEEPSS